MIRCLGDVYTIDFLDFVSIDACILALSDIPVNPGESPHDFPSLQHFFHQNTPFKVSFRRARRDMIFRNRYNNHRVYNHYLSYIHKKSTANIKKSYSIALTCWILRCFSGLFLADLGYVI